MSKVIEGFNPANREEVAKIIADCENWDGYEGKNIDGEDVLVFVQKGDCMVIKTRHKAKPRFWECVEYDSDGLQVGVMYEAA